MRRRENNKHTEKRAQAKRKQRKENNDQDTRLRPAISHAFSSGWVQNSGTGFLLAACALVAAIMTSTQIKAAAIVCALAGTAFLWIAAVLVIKHETPEQPPFVVAIESAIVAQERDHTQRFCIINGNIVSPIPVWLFLRFVNNQDIPSDISRFHVDIELKKGTWIFPSSWLETAQIPEHVTLGWANPDPDAPHEIELGGGPLLLPLFRSRAIKPHETVRGWILLDATREYDDAPQPLIFRFDIKDSAGHRLTQIDPNPDGGDNVSHQPSFTSKGVLDINGMTVKHYADASPPSN